MKSAFDRLAETPAMIGCVGILIFGFIMFAVTRPEGRVGIKATMIMLRIWGDGLLGACLGLWVRQCFRHPFIAIPVVLVAFGASVLVVRTELLILPCALATLLLNSILGMVAVHRHQPLNFPTFTGLVVVGFCGGLVKLDLEGGFRWLAVLVFLTGLYIGWDGLKPKPDDFQTLD